jgi:hypothetical protein
VRVEGVDESGEDDAEPEVENERDEEGLLGKKKVVSAAL